MNNNSINTNNKILDGYFLMDDSDFAGCTGDYIPISYETAQRILTDEDRALIDARLLKAQKSKFEKCLSSYFDTKLFAAKTALAKQNHFSKLYYAQQ